MSENTATIAVNPVAVCETKHADCRALVHRPECGRYTRYHANTDPTVEQTTFESTLAAHHAGAARGLCHVVLDQKGWTLEVKDAALRLACNHLAIAEDAALRLVLAAQSDAALRRPARKACRVTDKARWLLKQAEWQLAADKTQG